MVEHAIEMKYFRPVPSKQYSYSLVNLSMNKRVEEKRKDKVRQDSKLCLGQEFIIPWDNFTQFLNPPMFVEEKISWNSEILHTAKRNVISAQNKQRQHYNHCCRQETFQMGDLILLKNSSYFFCQ